MTRQGFRGSQTLKRTFGGGVHRERVGFDIGESLLAEYHQRQSAEMEPRRPQFGDHWPSAHLKQSVRRLNRCRRHSVWATVVILACASVSGAQPEPRQVLLLYSYRARLRIPQRVCQFVPP